MIEKNQLDVYLSEHSEDHIHDLGSCQYETIAAILAYALKNKLTAEQLAQDLELNIDEPITRHDRGTIADYIETNYIENDLLDEDDLPILDEMIPHAIRNQIASENVPLFFEFEKNISSDLWSSASIADDFLTIKTEPFESNYKLVTVEGYFENRRLAVETSYGLWYETADEAFGLYCLILFDLVNKSDYLAVYGDFDT